MKNSGYCCCLLQPPWSVCSWSSHPFYGNILFSLMPPFYFCLLDHHLFSVHGVYWSLHNGLNVIVNMATFPVIKVHTYASRWLYIFYFSLQKLIPIVFNCNVVGWTIKIKVEEVVTWFLFFKIKKNITKTCHFPGVYIFRSITYHLTDKEQLDRLLLMCRLASKRLCHILCLVHLHYCTPTPPPPTWKNIF